jgi:hypothetical protein
LLQDDDRHIILAQVNQVDRMVQEAQN